MTGSARLFHCVRCHTQVIVCSCCDHGQIYCSRECSQKTRAISCRLAGQRYQISYRGKLNHAARQRRYMERQRAKKEKVTHHGSLEKGDCAPLSAWSTRGKDEVICCHFCKKPVDPFLRRGFLNSGGTRTTNWARAP